jgi:four helix bundle suffix protein
MSELIPKHGGYRKLKGFQVAQLAFDVTVRFVERYVDRFSRTKDQMVQAARSGVQNIAEGSQASATSKKMEIKLTQVARASLEELRLDYEDFLRQRGLPALEPQHPALLRFKALRASTLAEVQAWVADERRRGLREARVGETRTDTETRTHTDGHGRTGTKETVPESVKVPERPCPSVSPRPCQSVSSCPAQAPLAPECLAANAALSLLNLACYLLDRQVERLAKNFETEGGFTERLYKVRTAKRRHRP